MDTQFLQNRKDDFVMIRSAIIKRQEKSRPGRGRAAANSSLNDSSR